MNALNSSYHLSTFETVCAKAAHEMPHPEQAQVETLGFVLANEVLDTLLNSALEDYVPTIVEGLIGGLHSAAGRIQREAERASDEMRRLHRDFDGSEIKDVELQEATLKFNRAEAAVMIIEVLRDSAAETYTSQTGEIWTPWRGSAKNQATSYAQIEVREALRAKDRREQGMADPGAQVVVFRGAPYAKQALDAGRIFDALNWALEQYPDMRLATTGNHGAEQIALKWARGKKMNPILAKADFDKHGRSAPFKANDLMLQLDPVLVLTLDASLEPTSEMDANPFGPAANMAQKARERGIRTMAVTHRR